MAGEGFAGVCFKKPWKFGYWNKNDPNCDYLSGPKPFAQAQRTAEQVISGAVPDPTSRATHYYATTIPKVPT